MLLRTLDEADALASKVRMTCNALFWLGPVCWQLYGLQLHCLGMHAALPNCVPFQAAPSCKDAHFANLQCTAAAWRPFSKSPQPRTACAVSLFQEQVVKKVNMTTKSLRDAVDNIRGAVMICYPMGLPEWDIIRAELEDTQDLAGTSVSDYAHGVRPALTEYSVYHQSILLAIGLACAG